MKYLTIEEFNDLFDENVSLQAMIELLEQIVGYEISIVEEGESQNESQ